MDCILQELEFENKGTLMLKKMMIIALLCASHCANSQDISTQKTINWGNVVKATFVSGASAVCASFYYTMILDPYVIMMAKEQGFSSTIDFNKKFIQEHPETALIFAIPLFASVGFALIARDYMKKIWKKQKNS